MEWAADQLGAAGRSSRLLGMICRGCGWSDLEFALQVSITN